jgi:hypothetical protein
MGPDGLRWALATVLCLLLVSALLYGLAIKPYQRRLVELDAKIA